MNCSDCANKQNHSLCRTMRSKPKVKWCHMTVEQALKAEKAVVEYSQRQSEEGLTPLEKRGLRIAEGYAYARIKELEALLSTERR